MLAMESPSLQILKPLLKTAHLASPALNKGWCWRTLTLRASAFTWFSKKEKKSRQFFKVQHFREAIQQKKWGWGEYLKKNTFYLISHFNFISHFNDKKYFSKMNILMVYSKIENYPCWIEINFKIILIICFKN